MLKKTYKNLGDFFCEDLHFLEVTQKGSITFLLKVLATGTAFFFNLFLAKIYGAETSGEYFLSLTVVMISLIFCKLGLDNTLMRFVSEYESKKKFSVVNDIYFKSVLISAFISILIFFILFLLADEIAISIFNKKEVAYYIKVMGIGLIPAAMSYLHSGALKGLKKTTLAAIVDPFLMSTFNLCLVYPFYYLFGLKGVAYIFVGSQFLVSLVAFYLWNKSIPTTSKRVNIFPVKRLLMTSLPLLFVASMEIIIKWTDTIILGIWVTSAQVGVYNIAIRIALMASFVLVAINSITAPKFSELYHNGEIKVLENLAKKSALLMAVLALPFFIFCMTFPEWLLSFFGNGFTEGANVVRIISIGQYFNVIMGSVGYLLIMTGYEKVMQYVTLSAALTNIILNILFVPLWGLEGAAFATMVNLIMVNSLATIFVYNKIGILPFPFINLSK